MCRSIRNFNIPRGHLTTLFPWSLLMYFWHSLFTLFALPGLQISISNVSINSILQRTPPLGIWQTVFPGDREFNIRKNPGWEFQLRVREGPGIWTDNKILNCICSFFYAAVYIDTNKLGFLNSEYSDVDILTRINWYTRNHNRQNSFDSRSSGPIFLFRRQN